MKKKTVLLVLILSLLLSVSAYAAEPDETVECVIEAQYIKKYGNCILSADAAAFGETFSIGDILEVSFLGRTLELPLCENYTDVDSGLPGVFLREGTVTLAVNNGDFATGYGIAVKTVHEDKSVSWSYCEGVEGPVPVTIRLSEAGGYYQEYLMHNLVLIENLDAAPELTAADFANFRAVTTTGMGANVLYRASSPIDDTYFRAAYADDAMRAAGITCVVDLANDAATAQKFPAYDGSYFSGVSKVHLNMGVDVMAPDFGERFAEALRWMIAKDGSCCIICGMGKDRTGFTCAILECLMGAGYDEVCADYLLSYRNFYGLTPEETAYFLPNLTLYLAELFGTDDLKNADLSAAAGAYLQRIGMTETELDALKAKLSGAETEPAPAASEPVPAPTPADPAEYVRYIVQPGDCLWNLAAHFLGDPFRYAEIADLSGVKNPSLILVGQELLIPAA